MSNSLKVSNSKTTSKVVYHDELKNYRPVSNIQFISKIIEKIVMKRIDEYLVSNYLYDPIQTAYKINHSTETVISKLHNNIIQSFDQGDCTVLASLDLSAAFDTVDHNIFLVAKLKATFGIKDTAIEWISSYLTYRTQQVLINGTLSKGQNLECGVPQGSVLGAMMYMMYVYDLSKTICQHNVK